MPDFKLPDAAGKNITLQELLGKGPVLIDFWADYCKPCKDAMPQLNTLAEKYDSLTVVMISIDPPKNLPKAKEKPLGSFIHPFLGLTCNSGLVLMLIVPQYHVLLMILVSLSLLH